MNGPKEHARGASGAEDRPPNQSSQDAPSSHPPRDASPSRPPRDAPPPEERKRRTRWLYVRVILVQVIALVALWLLQTTYGS